MGYSIEPTQLIGVRAKIERAEYHINDLDARITSFKESKPYRIVSDRDPQTGQQIDTVEVIQNIPIEINIIAGETVHQLRSSLDHLAWQLVEHGGGSPGGDTSFPICKTPPKDETKFLGKIKGMSPEAISLVKAVQPYQSGYGLLWKLAELDNFDKHLLLFLFSFELKSSNINSWEVGETSSRLADLIVFEDGTQLHRLGGDRDYDLDLAFEVAFAEPEIVKAEPIVIFLTQTASFVNGVVNLFVDCFR